MVEFALVFPMVLSLCLGLIGGAWLFWQSASLSDGAKGGVRAASIVNVNTDPGRAGSTPLDFYPSSGPDPCASGGNGWGIGGESNSPLKIEAVVAHDADQVPVNNLPLCAGPAVADSQYGGSVTPAIAAAANAHPTTDCNGSNHAIQLRQLSPSPSKATIYVDVPPGQDLCNATRVILVTLRSTQGLAPPLSIFYPISAASEMPCSPNPCG
jgi:Flp pilus assembly protein TadG